ncbi:hydrophobe/amphiphile efflux-1 family RND transporter [Pleurocapsa sp. CCALA 161]|uniref:efflux RND transporter permease subunit n=1 Tax=Pleurocapsa sp. CCALA 161 TaxID=2107688 RepID=UPI000D04B89D|nr:efflux RND transporter permease subunit [Pleurocapsa sp. CCALA 161]PSB12253.1 hydrophobe/amphiphile efflux-1 family RND transporter [Pleurocapsa sp. CCALA 161]
MLLSIANTFIKRPVLTTVISIITVLVGVISIPMLPISQLPQIAPIQVEVTSSYIGADAETAETNVTSVIEREVNGVENMSYISSNTSNDGVSNIVVSFPPDVDRDIAQVNVQNRVALADPQLPSAVQQTGVTVQKSSPDLLLGIAFFAENGEYDDLFLSNYLDLYLLDQVKRIEGVGQAVIFGERKYAMRLWLNPDALAARNLGADTVVNALEEQNIQVGAGKIGQQPSPQEQKFEFTLRANSRLESVEEFENLVVATGEEGNLIKLKDVGRAELGAENYDTSAKFKGDPAVGMGIFQLPGSNALEVGTAVKEAIAELSQAFPPGMNYQIALDATEFVQVSLKEVVITLVQAVLLVVLILFIFLQDWRTTLIPAIAIPVSLVGAFTFLNIFGFQINTLTLFAMVLSTGVVVDDAIVVVEAIATKVERGMKPRLAAMDTMDELSGAVIATSLVLAAVFIPVSFFPGSTGVIFKQFSLTIVFAIALSTFNALSFSPAMAGLLLRPANPNRERNILGKFFNKFNQVFSWIIDKYTQAITFLAKKIVRPFVLAAFTALVLFTYFLYNSIPTGFIPEEDQGYFFTIVQAPDGVSLNYTQDIMEQIGNKLGEVEDVESYFALSGFGFDGNGSNRGFAFTKLKPWDERRDTEQSVYAILGRLNASFQSITGARALAVNAPPVRGLSTFGGFEFQLQDRIGLPISALVENANNVIAAASQRPELANVFTQFAANTPQIEVSVNRDRAKALGINVDDIFDTLQSYLGSRYVNDFVLEQRQYRVYVQADSNFRANPQDINKLYVSSANDQLVSLGTLVELKEFTGPQTITHYNLFRSINIQGTPAPGFSTGQAIQAMEEVATQTLPSSLGYEWTGTALEEKSSGGQSVLIFGLGLLMAFLVLAAQYESYVDPFIIILTVPLAVLGAIAAIWIRANIFQAGSVWPIINNDVYVQVGLVMLIGLASKNAILIVEYANQLREQGLNIVRAAIKAGQERFRPILMTAISSLVGFYPLLVATGAGASSRWSLGTAVFGGMLVTTVIGLFIVPSLYIMIKSLESLIKKDKGSGSSGHGKSNDSDNGRVPARENSEAELTSNYKLDRSGQNS